MPAFAELLRYRREVLAAWQVQPKALARAWHTLPGSARQPQGAAFRWLAQLWWWEQQVGFPNLTALLDRRRPRFVLASPPAAFPSPETMLADYRTWREAALARVASLDGAGWSYADRHPHFGIRTVQWWVERSLAVGHAALQHIPCEEDSQ